jgi:hypothetical protein
MLFVGTGVLPCVSGNVVNINATDINTNNSNQGHKAFYFGFIKEKKSLGDTGNHFTFTIILGLAIESYDEDVKWLRGGILVEQNMAISYGSKIGIFGNNFICAMFLDAYPW